MTPYHPVPAAERDVLRLGHARGGGAVPAFVLGLATMDHVFCLVNVSVDYRWVRGGAIGTIRVPVASAAS